MNIEEFVLFCIALGLTAFVGFLMILTKQINDDLNEKYKNEQRGNDGN